MRAEAANIPATQLFSVVSDPKPIKLPPPRKLLPEQVSELNGRESFYVDARVTIGFLWWKHQVDCRVMKNRMKR